MSPMLIDYLNDTDEELDIQMLLVDDLLHYAAQEEQVSDLAELSVTFVDDKRIQELNRDFREKDQPTDVISFALLEETDDG